jgi:hypothetical protein
MMAVPARLSGVITRFLDICIIVPHAGAALPAITRDATPLLEGKLRRAVMIGNALKLFADFTSATS